MTGLSLCHGAVTLTVKLAFSTPGGGGYGLWDSGIWNTSKWGPDDVWTDVSAYVEEVTTSRRIDSKLRTWSAGTFTIVLNDKDGRFSPDNLAGPYVVGGISTIIPGRGVMIQMAVGGITYDVMYARCSSISERPVKYGPRKGTSETVITGEDTWTDVANGRNYPISVPVGSGDTFGQRIARILTTIGYNEDLDINDGAATFQPTDFSQSPSTEIATTVFTEGGSAYIDKSGRFCARGIYAIVDDTRSNTVQAKFGDGGYLATGEIPWESITVTPLDSKSIINYATYCRVDGTPQVAWDDTSIGLYGTRDDLDAGAMTMTCESDAHANTRAQWAIATSAQPETMVDSIVLSPWCSPTVIGAAALKLEIRDLVQVKQRPSWSASAVITKSCFVSGISHTISRGGWSTGLQFASATLYIPYAASHWDNALWDTAVWFI